MAVAYFGDGAMTQGYVFECLNFCQVLKLPLLFVCENNGYGEYTAFRSVTAGEIRARAEIMGVPAETIDGMSVWTVREAAARALAHVRAGNGPAFVEALTYRFVGHSRSDPGKYRPEGELERWQDRDPLIIARQRLMPGEAEGMGAAAGPETAARDASSSRSRSVSLSRTPRRRRHSTLTSALLMTFAHFAISLWMKPANFSGPLSISAALVPAGVQSVRIPGVSPKPCRTTPPGETGWPSEISEK